jgi:hypothetical protein
MELHGGVRAVHTPLCSEGKPRMIREMLRKSSAEPTKRDLERILLKILSRFADRT